MKSAIALILLSCLGLSFGARIDYKVPSCLLATIDASATYTINGSPVTLQNTAASNGSCSDTKSSLEIKFEKNATLQMNFELVNGYSILTSMTFTFIADDTEHIATKNLNKNLSAENQWYGCDDPTTFTLEGNPDVTVTIKSIKIQAFGVRDNRYSDSKVSCEAAPTVTPTTGITTKTSQASTPTPTATATPTSNSPKPTVSPAPVAKSVSVNVTENGKVCILVKFTGTISVRFTNNTGQNSTYYYPIDQVKRTVGTCGNESQVVDMTLLNDWQLQFTFSKIEPKKSVRRLLADVTTYTIKEVSLTYGNIPHDSNPGPHVAKNTSADVNTANVGQAYSCASEETIKMQNVSLSTVDLMTEAFRDSKTGTFSANPRFCPADSTNTSNVVPIVVGVVLALLILVIIIAYLIGRRRNQTGYQSV